MLEMASILMTLATSMPASPPAAMRKLKRIACIEWALFMLVLCYSIASAVYYKGYIIDDAAITFRYARHVAEGHGLAFNMGEKPSEGYTNFLWTMMMVPIFWFKLDPIASSQVVGVLCNIFAVSLLYLVSRLLACGLPFVSLLPVLLLATNPSYAIWTVSGLEPVMLSAFILASFYFLGLARRQSSMKLHILSAVFFSLGLLTRPDMALFFIVALGFVCLWYFVSGKDRQLILWALIVLMVLLFYDVWKLLYFGSLVPNPFYVKGGLSRFSFTVGMNNFFALIQYNYNQVYFAIALFSTLIYVSCLLLRGTVKTGVKSEFSRLVDSDFWITYPFVVLAGYVFYLMGIAWDREIGVGRFLMHIMPLVYFVNLFGLKLLYGCLQKLCWKTIGIGRFKMGTGALAVYAIALLFVFFSYKNIMHGRKYYAGHRGVVETTYRIHKGVADYLNAHSQPGEVVIAQDMGFIPYFSKELVFVDTIGICNRYIAQELYKQRYNYYIRHLMWQDPELRDNIVQMDGRIKDYLKSRDAKWLLFFAYLAKDPGRRGAEAVAAIAAHRYDGFFDYSLEENNYFHGLFKDEEVRKKYRIEKAWLWNNQAYYVLYKRADT